MSVFSFLQKRFLFFKGLAANYFSDRFLSKVLYVTRKCDLRNNATSVRWNFDFLAVFITRLPTFCVDALESQKI